MGWLTLEVGWLQVFYVQYTGDTPEILDTYVIDTCTCKYIANDSWFYSNTFIHSYTLEKFSGLVHLRMDSPWKTKSSEVNLHDLGFSSSCDHTIDSRNHNPSITKMQISWYDRLCHNWRHFFEKSPLQIGRQGCSDSSQRFSLKCMGFKLMFDIGVKNHHWEYHFLHPPKINMEPKNGILEEEIQSLEIIIFRFHVNFRRCTSTSYYNFWFSFGMFRDILLMVQTSS